MTSAEFISQIVLGCQGMGDAYCNAMYHQFQHLLLIDEVPEEAKASLRSLWRDVSVSPASVPAGAFAENASSTMGCAPSADRMAGKVFVDYAKMKSVLPELLSLWDGTSVMLGNMMIALLAHNAIKPNCTGTSFAKALVAEGYLCDLSENEFANLCQYAQRAFRKVDDYGKAYRLWQVRSLPPSQKKAHAVCMQVGAMLEKSGFHYAV